MRKIDPYKVAPYSPLGVRGLLLHENQRLDPVLALIDRIANHEGQAFFASLVGWNLEATLGLAQLNH